MATVTIAGTLSFPLGDEATARSRTFGAALEYNQKNVFDVLVADGSRIDLLGEMSDVMACFVECTLGEGDLEINGASELHPLTVDDGFWVWFNPDGGLDSLEIHGSMDSAFRVYLFALGDFPDPR